MPLPYLTHYLHLRAFCRIKFWRDPHSAFFKEHHVYDMDYSLYREREAWHFVSRHNSDLNPPPYVKSDLTPAVCVAIVTVRRDSDGYFEASVGSLLEGLDERERSKLYLSVLFADTEPRVHTSWGQKWVERLTDSATTYNVSDDQFKHLQDLEREKNYYEKGVFDYLYALRTCQQLNAPYTIIFEDDIIISTAWLSKTLKALADISRLEQQSGKPWIYLRLFYTETALSWTSSDFAYRNMPLVFGVLILSGLICLISLRRSRFTQFHLDPTSIVVISMICIPAFTALVYMVGKYNLMPLDGVVEMNKSGCCTQGLVFPRERVDGLIDFLSERGHGQTDSMIEEYADSHKLNRYALAPPQLQHVGLKSSRDNLDINTRSTWAFWFETNDPIKLKEDHRRLLEDHDVMKMLNSSTKYD
ncbi:Glycosyl transferase, family 54 [Penicillium griseofulvum]|uniref:Glycosyl transferase, family 54 n=1 Tax=Penicillium patulum TaxID=5078 RepID=A0A135LC26_PENPA|nr:Glycosyl transferase, family 54 [Penicillium griseofulvum]KXG46518.1 Glycosyl transferase, family 54 [Penicillium griseofulvum]